MIRISALVDPDGFLAQLEAGGHAGWAETGSDPVCAAVSILLRTYGRLAEGQDGLCINARAGKPGDFYLSVRRGASPVPERWLGVGSMVLKGLSDLSRDYPENIIFEITVSDLEVNHGS